MNFSCSGTISKWTFVARSRTGGDRDQYPLFQLWRPDGIERYERVYESSNSSSGGLFTMADRESKFTVREYIPDNPVPFEAGYIFGVYQPRSGNSRLSVRYARVPSGYGHLNYHRNFAMSLEVFNITQSPTGSNYPLVAVNASEHQKLTNHISVKQGSYELEPPGIWVVHNLLFFHVIHLFVACILFYFF